MVSSSWATWARWLVGALVPPALAHPLVDEAGEVLVGPHAGGEGKGGEGRAQVGEAEGAALGDRQGGAEPGLVAAPAPAQLRRPLEIPFAVGAQARPHRVERPFVAQGGEDVVHDAPGGEGVVDVVGDHPRDA